MNKIIVSDASTLILLQKVILLDSLVKNFDFIISEEVCKEAVVHGKTKKFSDSYQIENKINQNLIKIKKIKDKKGVNKIINEFGIAEGEAEAITLFLQEKADVLAIDDHKSINVCKVYKIPFMTALTFVLDSHSRKIIEKNEAKEMIKNLAIYGRYKDELIYKALNYLLVSVTTRLGLENLEYIKKVSKMFNLDKSTAFRDILQKGVREDKKEKALELYIKGKFSIGQAARFADMHIGEFFVFIWSKGIESNLTLEDFNESLKHAKALT
ncbi:UPF0175 family protein [Candidatus Woesearchaeota archaeon]|nr:UPF0175 family protein [Candidatus Woesearchaeota archaeon]